MDSAKSPASVAVQPSPSPRRGAASIVGGAVVLVAIVDAAVETFLAGSPLRSWIAPAALAFVALSAWAWRPGGPLGRARNWPGVFSVPLFALLLLLALTAWLPDGQANGVRMLRQPTPVVLAGVSALAVALAGVLLARVRALPAWMRAIIGALSVYGTASFALGAAHGAPYASLLRGAAFWTRLPFWLQGAFVGGLVLIPAALLAGVAQVAARRLRHAAPAAWTGQQVIALALSLVMAVSGAIVPGATSAPAPNAGAANRQTGPPPIAAGTPFPANLRLEPPPPPPPDPTLEQVKADFAELAQRLPEARYKAEARARVIGPGIEGLFQFVRDNVRYEAYSGILRGANGTLAARAGNSFDRSVLLARMLAAHGVRTRYARGELPTPEAERLFAQMFDRFTPPAAGNGSTQAARFWERVTARARRDYTVIRAALGSGVRSNGQASREQALRDIRQHAWLQAEVNGAWMDLDTSFADAAAGRRYCEPMETQERVPDSWYQRVTLRVLAERLEDGKLTTTVALQETRPAVDLVDEEIFLLHVPPRTSAGGFGLGTAGAGGADTWSPALLIGGDIRVGKTIVFGKSGGESTGFFDALGGSASTDFVAEWLEFEIARPDGRRDVTRRALADRAPAAWRTATPLNEDGLKPLDRDGQGIVAARAVRNIWLSAGPHNLRAFNETVLDAAESGRGSDEPPDIQLLPLAALNFAALIWADHAAIPALNDLPDVRLYTDSPRIVIVTMVPDDKGNVLEEYDLRRDTVFGVARNAASDGLVVDRKIWFGALEGALEHETVARDLAIGNQDDSSVSSTSSLVTPDGVVTLGPADTERVRELGADAERAARLSAPLRSGYSIVVPRAAFRSGPMGWWEVAPGGDTRAVIGEGLHGAAGGIIFNSTGGAKAIATRAGTWVIREPVAKPGPLANFGKERPRPQKSKALEYGSIVALIAISALTGWFFYSVVLRHIFWLAEVSKELDQWEAAHKK